MPPPCPTREQYELFLSDGLPQADEDRLGRHLEECPSCVSVMEELTDPRRLAPAASSTLRVRRRPPALPESELSQLRLLMPPSGPLPGSPPPAPLELPFVPGYEIERELGRGGMGVVYLARQTQLNRHVALKMLLAGRLATPDEVVRFLAEAQTCAGLRHDNIVQVYEVGHHAGTPYFSMEYVEGGTLAERVRRRPLAPREAADLIERLARAIHVAHQHGVIHRDLKPVNVLLREAGTDATAFGVPKVSDFGLAKSLDRGSDLTLAGTLLGTPDYMAPEQVRPDGSPLGPGVDVHALGAILYHLLAGRPPFAAPTTAETLRRVTDLDPLDPSRFKRAVPRDLSVICLRCLEKRTERRYGSAEALADDLARFLRGEPIAARPVTPLERLVKWAGRNPAAAALSGLVAAVVVATISLAGREWYAAEEAREQETRRANDEAAAKQAEARARHDAQVVSARFALDGGIQDCRAGRVRAGLLRMAEALQLLPPDEPDTEFAIRANFGAWRPHLCPARPGPAHGTAVTCVAFSPDGRTVVTGNWGNVLGRAGPGQVQLWRVADWGAGPVWTADHPGSVWSVAFSPDGTRVAVGGLDGTACLHDAKTGRPLFPPFPHAGLVMAVAFSPDGKTLAAGGTTAKVEPDYGTGEVRFWDAATGTEARTKADLPFRVFGVAWHPDGSALALGGRDPGKTTAGAYGVAAVLDLTTRTLREPQLTHCEVVTAVAFHPDGKTLATGCRDGLVRFWGYPTGRLLPKPLRHANPVTGIRYSSAGDRIATASGDQQDGTRSGTGEVHVWDTATGSVLVAPLYTPSPGHSQKMHGVAFGPDDRQLVAACEHGCAWLWDLPTPVRPRAEFFVPDRADVVHSPDGRTMLLCLMPERSVNFGNRPCEIRVVDVETGRTTARLPHPVVVRTRFSPDGTRFLTFTHPDAREVGVWLWEAATGREVPLPAAFGRQMTDVRFTAGGAILAVAADGTARAWDARALTPTTPAVACLRAGEHVLDVDAASDRLLAFGPEGLRVVAAADGRTLTASATGPAGPPQKGGGMPHASGAFTADGSAAVATWVGARSSIRRWRAGDAMSESAHPVGFWLVNGRHPDGRRVLLTDEAGRTARLYDVPTGRFETPAIPIHGGCGIHPGGELLATAGASGTSDCQLWGVAGLPIGPAYPHGRLNDVQFNPNGRWLVTSGVDKVVKVWDLPAAARGSVAELRAAVTD